MAWTPVPAVAVGDLWTAADHNKYLRDNFAAEPPAFFGAVKGQMGIGSGVNTVSLMPATADPYDCLVADSAHALGVKWLSRPPGGIAVNAGAAQSIPDDAETTVTLGTEYYNEGGFYTGGNVITIPAGMGGTYHIGMYGYFDAVATAYKPRQLGVQCSYSGSFYATQAQDADFRSVFMTFGILLDLVAGETIIGRASHISGAAKNLNGARLWVVRSQ